MNTIAMRKRKEGQQHFAALLNIASTRIDVNGALRAALGAQKVSFADRALVVESSKMEFGGITVFGLPSAWSVIVDAQVMKRDSIMMGAGIRGAKLAFRPDVLLAWPGVEVASVAG